MTFMVLSRAQFYKKNQIDFSEEVCDISKWLPKLLNEKFTKNNHQMIKICGLLAPFPPLSILLAQTTNVFF